ncbi:hypothetical protein AVEN_261171-1 [Araneus ventricosus]|uniref:Uncharacterized protein n=1 Tax=Araneus ventricosus TaxID=182803 RepID=A0A4Y2JFT1_ARAVE|nr:hypothetical protein AVEN_261171-1 [Araneus ventricosus]
MRNTLPNVVLACDRTGVSDRSAEILINAPLKDIWIINRNDSSKVVDRSKIRRVDDYIDLIDWHSVTLTELPCIVPISDNGIKVPILRRFS